MSQPEVSTSTQRPRGKFLNSSSAVFGVPESDTGSNNRIPEVDSIAAPDHQSQIASTSLSSVIPTHPVFADLKKAESLVYDLLQTASSTADSLSKLAGASKDNGDTGSDLYSSHERKHLSDTIQQNGKVYFDTVKRIHSLLVPHANLVVSYKAYQDGVTNATSVATRNSTLSNSIHTAPLEQNTDEVSDNSNPMPDHTKPISDTTGSPKINNMYASRVETRLALERREVLDELLRLERDEPIQCTDDENEEATSCLKKNEVTENTISTGKRKRKN